MYVVPPLKTVTDPFQMQLTVSNKMGCYWSITIAGRRNGRFQPSVHKLASYRKGYQRNFIQATTDEEKHVRTCSTIIARPLDSSSHTISIALRSARRIDSAFHVWHIHRSVIPTYLNPLHSLHSRKAWTETHHKPIFNRKQIRNLLNLSGDTEIIFTWIRFKRFPENTFFYFYIIILLFLLFFLFFYFYTFLRFYNIILLLTFFFFYLI